jgi:4-carboxymuconolactone decarboxylase
MRLKQPRIAPLSPAEWDPETREVLEGLEIDGHVYNVFATLARHLKLFKRWLVFGDHTFSKSSLPAREREMVILRMGWLCRAEYEWGHHVAIGKQVGLGSEDIRRVAAGPDASGWDSFEAALLRAVDELHADSLISDTTWKALAGRYNTEQLLDLIFTAGQYTLVSMALNCCGVQLEEGFERFPDEAEG